MTQRTHPHPDQLHEAQAARTAPRKLGSPGKNPPEAKKHHKTPEGELVNLLASDQPGGDTLDPETVSDDRGLVRRTLRAVLNDTSAPAAAKVQAARTLAEINQMIGRDRTRAPGEDDGRDLRDMTAAELAAELAALGP